MARGSSRRPLVAVPAYPVPAGRVEGWVDAGIAVPLPYVEALKRAGAQEAVLMPETIDVAAAATLLGHFDALLLLGGGDLDPATYGAEPERHVYGVHAVRDAFELALCRAALTLDLPLLAICRGAQVLNVALGGTLDQHISDRFPGHGRPGVEGGATLHDLVIEAGSRVGDAMAVTSASCSSHHHQAVDSLGDALVVTARAPDGTVEAIEHADRRWAVGVQWHPEDTAVSDRVQQAIFDAFAGEARA